MKIQTQYFGEIDIHDDQRITFPTGIPGFQTETDFVLLNFDENPAFQLLQSITTAALAFVVINPFQFVTDYEIKLDEQLIKQLQIDEEADVLLLAFVTLNDALKSSTANLQAPIVVNQKRQLAKQFITHDSQYSTRELIFTTLSKAGEV
ncbi:flagellar assembly factor FliW [Amphibacillus marinus]|uniref:Flagellar assembly factor FliW n=1 Tax=Amphibacillus marinus TaxID=872970 RepID=A0A1H8QYB0_9BACI|nr:flagellar assembly protein FliW [Amphibacillus marinus]SEO59212.1 flagellar assembly factor FliW [Amphibacillus marinus]